MGHVPVYSKPDSEDRYPRNLTSISNIKYGISAGKPGSEMELDANSLLNSSYIICYIKYNTSAPEEINENDIDQIVLANARALLNSDENDDVD
ncbi:10709_t:CDS:2 [Funneliformis geosporum]|nr:10709_t:CDS:2 [Funneliformis geosporum]